MRKRNNIKFNGINPFDITINYIELNSHSIENQFESHIHSECEIYINISGDVSFAVEDKIYPVKQGDIIITRPYEYHHCIYNSNELHKHFWILLKPNNNNSILNIFFERFSGTNNLLTPNENSKNRILSVCEKMLEENISENEKYLCFFSLLTLLEQSKENAYNSEDFYDDTLTAIKYIYENYSDEITIKKLSNVACVSIKTLERHFYENLKITPAKYIKNLRMAKAAYFLSTQISVQDAAEKSGFTDYSRFISDFKKVYGLTPLKFKKSCNKSDKG